LINAIYLQVQEGQLQGKFIRALITFYIIMLVLGYCCFVEGRLRGT